MGLEFIKVAGDGLQCLSVGGKAITSNCESHDNDYRCQIASVYLRSLIWLLMLRLW